MNTEYVLLMVIAALAVVLGVGYLAGVMNDKHISLADALWGKGIPSLTAGWSGGGSGSGSGSGGGIPEPNVDGHPISFVINMGGSVTVWTDTSGTPTYKLVENGTNVLVDNSDSPTMTINPTLGGFTVRIDDNAPSSTETTIVNGFWSAPLYGTDNGDGTIRIYSDNPYGFSNFTLYRDAVAVRTASNPDFTVTDAGSHTYTIHDGKDIPSQSFSTSAFAAHPTFFLVTANKTLAQFNGSATYTTRYGSGFGWKAVTADTSGNVWAVRRSPSEVYVYDPTGGLIRSWTVAGTVSTVTYLSDIQLDEARGVVYVADAATTAGNEQIHRYTTDGTLIGSWTMPYRPSAISLDADGNIYIAESSATRIRVINPSGTQLRVWGSAGTGDGQFFAGAASCIAVDKQSNTVYVVDRGNKRIQAFTTNGTFLRKWSIAGELDVNDPSSVNVDWDGNVYVTNSNVNNNRVVVYSSTGTKLGTLTDTNAYGAQDIAFVRHIDPTVLK